MKTQPTIDKLLAKEFPLTARELAEALPRFRSLGANQDFLAAREALSEKDDDSLNSDAALNAPLTVGHVVSMLARSYWAVMDLDDEIAEAGSVTERLSQAIAKEESIGRMLEMQKALIRELVEQAEKSGDLIGPSEMAKALGVPVRSLAEYAEKKRLPFYQIGKHRKYNKAEVMAASKAAANDGKPGIDADTRRRLLR